MTPVRLKPAAPRSCVKQSTTEPLRSNVLVEKINKIIIFNYALLSGGLSTEIIEYRNVL